MADYVRLSAVLFFILLLGTAACLPLYRWRIAALVRSQLFVKCMMWIPIYAVFTLIVASPYYGGIIAALAIIVLGITEFMRQARKKLTWQAVAYSIFFIIVTTGVAGVFLLLPNDFRPVVIAAAISSVLSDVFAFFSGKFLGRHKLPQWINSGKSWEGVAGQIVGGIVGMAIVIVAYGSSIGLLFGVTIGCASAIGDIANSIAKRSLDIKDWSRAIPGHGGILDRFSSLSTAFAAAFIIIVIGRYGM